MKTTDLISIAGVLALALSTAACELGEKNVGAETETSDGGSDGGGTDGGDGGTGSATNGNSTSPTAGSASADGGSDGSDSGGDTGGVWDPCADAPCGQACSVCDPDDPACAPPPIETVCNGAGACVEFGGEVCAGPSLEPAFEAGLTTAYGCGDIYMYAVNDNDTILLGLSESELVAMTGAAGTAQQYALDFADGGTLSLTVDVGQYASAYACNDAIENKPVIVESWTAVSGTVVFDVGVPDEFGNAMASATLTDVVIETPAGDQLTIASFTFTDIAVGWLPG